LTDILPVGHSNPSLISFPTCNFRKEEVRRNNAHKGTYFEDRNGSSLAIEGGDDAVCIASMYSEFCREWTG
jgi:hypothetical protein